MLPLMGAIKGVAGIAGGLIGAGKRRRELREAKAEYARNKQRLMGLDTSNPYENMENTMEDLTVNTQQADFLAEQQQQAAANAMGGLQGAAGGSGIAALAQSLVGQQSKNLAAASASIGQQEASNQMAERQMAGQLQSQERQGELISRAQEKEKTETLFGMSQQRLGAAQAAKDAATKSIIGGVTGLAGSVIPQLPGAKALASKGKGFMANMLGGGA
jgi:hypothetical protein